MEQALAGLKKNAGSTVAICSAILLFSAERDRFTESIHMSRADSSFQFSGPPDTGSHGCDLAL